MRLRVRFMVRDHMLLREHLRDHVNVRDNNARTRDRLDPKVTLTTYTASYKDKISSAKNNQTGRDQMSRSQTAGEDEFVKLLDASFDILPQLTTGSGRCRVCRHQGQGNENSQEKAV